MVQSNLMSSDPLKSSGMSYPILRNRVTISLSVRLSSSQQYALLSLTYLQRNALQILSMPLPVDISCPSAARYMFFFCFVIFNPFVVFAVSQCQQGFAVIVLHDTQYRHKPGSQANKTLFSGYCQRNLIRCFQPCFV